MSTDGARGEDGPGRRGSARAAIASLAGAADRIKQASRGRPAPFSLALFSDETRLVRPDPVLRMTPPGSVFVYRDYSARARLRRGRALRALCRIRKILFLVAGDAGLAAALDADGVHLPEALVSARAVEVIRSRFALVTSAAHSAKALERAAAASVDAAFLSPVFATRSHPGAAAFGAETAMQIAAGARAPVLALGGVTPEGASRLVGSYFCGLGAIGAFV